MSSPHIPAAASIDRDAHLSRLTMNIRVRSVRETHAYTLEMIADTFSAFGEDHKAIVLQYMNASAALIDSLTRNTRSTGERLERPPALPAACTPPPSIPLELLTAAAAASMN